MASPHSERLAHSASLTLLSWISDFKVLLEKKWTELTDQWSNENWAGPSLAKNSSDQSNQGSGVFCCVTSRRMTSQTILLTKQTKQSRWHSMTLDRKVSAEKKVGYVNSAHFQSSKDLYSRSQISGITLEVLSPESEHRSLILCGRWM